MLGNNNSLPFSTFSGIQNVSQLKLLDIYTGATGAYSLRLLKIGYSGNCIKVRRSDTDATQDIGFSGNVIDSSALETFCDGNDGFVDTWYDQSGNGNNITTTADADEPRIVNSGTYDGGVVFDSAAKRLNFFNVDGDHTFFLVINTSDTGATLFDGRTNGGGFVLAMTSGSSNTIISNLVGTPTFYLDGVVQSWSTRGDVYTAINGSQKLITFADLDIASTVTEFTPMYMGDYAGGFELSPATVNEIIIYGSTLSSANRSGVEVFIMNHYEL